MADLTGFRDAQNRLRAGMGQDVDFKVPVTKTYASGVQLDPESGEPYDPTVVPTSGGGFTTVTVRALIVFRPIRGALDEPAEEGPRGISRGESMALDIAAADNAEVEDATEAEVNGVNYRITDWVPEGIQGTDRWIVFLEAR